MGWCVNHWHESTNGRHSLSHALAGVPAPSGREPGGCAPFNRVLAKILRYGRFSSPLRRLRNRFLLPFIGVLAKIRGWRAIFIAPTEGGVHSSKSEKMGVEFLGRVWYNSHGNRCRISSLVEWSLPKPQRRVRFPYPAPQKALASAGAFLIRKIRFFVEFSKFFGIIMEIPPPMEDMLWMR